VSTLIYVLCAITSGACAVLLWRGWRRSRARLLFWSSLCFVGLSLNNLLLVVDARVMPQADMAIIRMPHMGLGVS
jgi:hypothetical protein